MMGERIKEIFEKAPAYSKACRLISLLEADGFEAFIVGGAVRDALLEREIYDFDLATSAKPEEMLEVFKDFKTLHHGIDFGTLGVLVDDVPFEITTYRGDLGYTDNRHPDAVKFIRSKEEDLKRRDFTINAMMFNPQTGLYDPLGGAVDLERKLIRTVGDAEKRFEEDALRILRMMRFSVSLGFKIDEASLAASKTMLSSLKTLSKERVFAEIEKTLSKEIDWGKVDELTLSFLSVKIDRIELDKKLYDFEKAYVLSLFSILIPDLKNYVLPRVLHKDFEFYKFLAGVRGKAFKESFVKALGSSYRGEKALRFWKSLEVSTEVSINLKALEAYPSNELGEKIDLLKKNLSGPDLGAAILEAKIKSIF